MSFDHKHQVHFCQLCDTPFITCEFCDNSSCSGGGCFKCAELFKDFHFWVNENYIDKAWVLNNGGTVQESPLRIFD